MGPDTPPGRGHIALVTGATGYVGSNLSARLAADGWFVHAVVRESSDLAPLLPIDGGVTVHRHDGSTEGMVRIFREAAPEVVFHLAAVATADQHDREEAVPLLMSNVVFPVQVLEGMAATGTRLIVNTGTFSQHYEDSDYDPTNLYAATKQAFESILLYYIRVRGFTGVTLVLFDTYGPRDPRPKVFAQLREAVRTGKPLAMSPGGQLLDLVFIDDVMEAYVRCAWMLMNQQVPAYERYAASSGERRPLREVVEVYGQVTGTPVPVDWGGRPYRPREVMVPWTRGNPVPGWSPRVDLIEGIRVMEGSQAP